MADLLPGLLGALFFGAFLGAFRALGFRVSVFSRSGFCLGFWISGFGFRAWGYGILEACFGTLSGCSGGFGLQRASKG